MIWNQNLCCSSLPQAARVRRAAAAAQKPQTRKQTRRGRELHLTGTKGSGPRLQLPGLMAVHFRRRGSKVCLGSQHRKAEGTWAFESLLFQGQQGAEVCSDRLIGGREKRKAWGVAGGGVQVGPPSEASSWSAGGRTSRALASALPSELGDSIAEAAESLRGADVGAEAEAGEAGASVEKSAGLTSPTFSFFPFFPSSYSPAWHHCREQAGSSHGLVEHGLHSGFVKLESYANLS